MTDIIKFKSGLRLAYQYMASTRSVSMGMFVGTGSARENASNNGISHFIEHMMFKGTERRTAYQIAEEMESIGASVNAYTSRDCTCYYAIGTNEHAEQCADYLSDILFHSTFEKECLEKEKGVVIEEINMCEDDPSDICEDLILNSIYGDKGYGRGILGPKKNVKKFTKEDIKDYMSKYYRAGNMVLTIVGNIEKAQAVAYAEKYFESEFLKFSHNKVAKIKPPEVYTQSLVREKSCEQANIAFAFPTYSIKDKKIFSPVTFARAVGGNMSSRLFQKLREENGLVYDVDASVYTYEGKSAFIISLATAPNNVERAVAEVRKVLLKLIEEGFTDKEVSTCKEQYKVGLVLGTESSAAVMRLIGKLAVHGLNFDIDERLSTINALTKEDLNSAMREVLNFDVASAAYVGKGCEKDILDILTGKEVIE